MKKPDGLLTRTCTGLNGRHEYPEKTCPHCGAVFCYACCLWTNVDQGGKHEPDSMLLCPACGNDYFCHSCG